MRPEAATIDEMIASGASLRDLRPHFPSKEETIQYYASYNCSLYPSQPSTDACCACGRNGSATVAFRWLAMLFKGIGFGKLELLMLFVGHLGLKVQHQIVAFETFHPVCQSCWRSLRWKKGLAMMLNFIGFALLLFGLLIAPLGFLMPLFVKFKPDENAWVPVLVGIGGLVLIVLYPALMGVARRLQIPPPLRGIPRRPFQYASSRLVA